MSSYKVEEPDEISETIITFSKYQRIRYNKVLNQLKETWFDVYSNIKFLRDNATMTIEISNHFMLNIHKMFIISHKNKTNYYNDEKNRLRKQKNYIKNKILKIKNSKSKL